MKFVTGPPFCRGFLSLFTYPDETNHDSYVLAGVIFSLTLPPFITHYHLSLRQPRM